MLEDTSFPLKVASYASQCTLWPKSGNHILAQFDDDSIIVYQAYNPVIARALVEAQNYHALSCEKAGFSMNRMTWIKTNFLWMMYRSEWATKENQERILAIRLSRAGFEEILSKAVASSGDDRRRKTDEVRLQWDPDHSPSGGKHGARRAIQLGLRGDIVRRMSEEFIISIDDITDFVALNRQRIKDYSDLMTPVETLYPLLNDEIAQRIKLSAL